MNENTKKYLHRGFIWHGKYWEEFGLPPDIKDITYKNAKTEFSKILDEIVYSIAFDKSVLWTLSSGLDTSIILHHLKKYDKNPNTVCFDNGREDTVLSSRLANDWGFKNHQVVKIDPSKIEEYLIELNSIFSTPIAHPYLLISYFLFKYAEENGYNTLVMGDGPDVSMLGTHHFHKKIVEAAIRLGQYDLNSANNVIKHSYYVEKTLIDKSTFLYNSLKNYPSKNIQYNMRLFSEIWWPHEIKNYVDSWKLLQNTIEHRIWAEWIQFIVRTRWPTDELLKTFSFKQKSPYLTMSNFCLSLPVHYRYTLNSTKHLMFDNYGEYLPSYILHKKRTGFNPSELWAEENKKIISYLLDEYVYNSKKVIHKYVNEEIFHTAKTFEQQWALINLSMWLEKNEN